MHITSNTDFARKQVYRCGRGCRLLPQARRGAAGQHLVVSLQDICKVATCSFIHTLTKHSSMDAQGQRKHRWDRRFLKHLFANSFQSIPPLLREYHCKINEHHVNAKKNRAAKSLQFGVSGLACNSSSPWNEQFKQLRPKEQEKKIWKSKLPKGKEKNKIVTTQEHPRVLLLTLLVYRPNTSW